MISIHVSEIIERPVGEVFAFAGCADNDSLWRTGLSARWPIVSGPPVANMLIQETVTYLGNRFTMQGVIETVEADARVTFRSTRATMPMWGQRLFEPVGNHTYFTYELTLDPTGTYGLLPALTADLFTRLIREDVGMLKQLLESRNETGHEQVAVMELAMA